jgi:hypothetical protein
MLSAATTENNHAPPWVLLLIGAACVAVSIAWPSAMKGLSVRLYGPEKQQDKRRGRIVFVRSVLGSTIFGCAGLVILVAALLRAF